MKINTNYSQSYAQKIYSNKTNSEIHSNVNSNVNNNSHKSKTRTIKYILEGGVIKVYLFEDGIKKQCIKSIPLSQATPDILAKVGNLTFGDFVKIFDMQKEEKDTQKLKLK